jgi:hypothetical protein
MLNAMLGNFEITERDQKLHELATRYHTECELYDRTVCTGPTGLDGVMPATPREMALINRNAHAVRKRIELEAERDGFTREELARAISKWHGQVPNVQYTPWKVYI